MNNDTVNMNRLHSEMCHEPLWYIDKQIFANLILTTNLTNPQLLEIARLSVKYGHILHRSELQRCFNYLIKKTHCISIDQLYNITRELYNDRSFTKIK